VTLALAAPSGGRSPGGPGSLGSPSRAFTRQAGRFALIGSAGTGAALALYALLGLWMDPLVAIAAAWLLTTLTTNGFQRHFAFSVTDPARAPLDHTVALISSLVSLVASSAVLAPLTTASPAQQLTALTAVSSVVGAARFLAVRWWLGPASPRLC
jgi:putative flippase GtrA